MFMSEYLKNRVIPDGLDSYPETKSVWKKRNGLGERDGKES